MLLSARRLLQNRCPPARLHRTISTTAPAPAPAAPAGGASAPAQPPVVIGSGSGSSGGPALSAEERYMFDTFGYVVLRGRLPPAEVRALRAALAAHPEDFHERHGALRNSREAAYVGDETTGRRDCGAMLGWPEDHAAPFRRLLAHPALVPVLHELVGDGYRLDHSPVVFSQVRTSFTSVFSFSCYLLTTHSLYSCPLPRRRAARRASTCTAAPARATAAGTASWRTSAATDTCT